MSTSLLLHHKYVPCWKHCFPWIESDSTYACAYECHSRRFLLSSLTLAEKLISSPPSPASRLAAITERPFSLLFIFHLSLLKSPWIHLLGLKAVCLQGKKKKNLTKMSTLIFIYIIAMFPCLHSFNKFIGYLFYPTLPYAVRHFWFPFLQIRNWKSKNITKLPIPDHRQPRIQIWVFFFFNPVQ